MRIGIYSPNWIGDSVLAIPFIQLLRKQEQDAEIIIICKDWVSGVYENHPAVNGILPFSNAELTGLANIIQTGQSLKKLDFDKFYTLTDSFRSAFILWLSGGSIWVGKAFFQQPLKKILIKGNQILDDVDARLLLTERQANIEIIILMADAAG